MNQKNQPSLEDLGLDQPIVASEKISIERLQRESEIERAEAILAQKPAESEENLLGVIGFCLSLLSVVTLGCLSPISLLVSFSAMKKKPRALATAGVVLSVVGCIFLATYIFLYGMGLFMNYAVDQRRIEREQSEANQRKIEFRKEFPDMPEGGEAPPR